MAKQKYKHVQYLHQDFPTTVFHPVDGSYLIVDDEASIPEGFIPDINDAENVPSGVVGPVACMNQVVPDKYKSKKTKKSAAKVDENVITLESLELNREEAIEILEEANVVFKKNASNAKLAELVNSILEE
tara:strand:+ start:10886 stop:11275 length:390 start_codon:yes stop_codon:yes gene_type:complete